MNYIGIDISKENFDVAIEQHNRYMHYRFGNNALGFKQFIQLLNKETDCCVMEASGPYYLKLAWYLQEKQYQVSVVNPLVIRRFCQMRLVKAKTDKKDAHMIALYGKAEHPQLWKPQAAYMLELQQMFAYLGQLDKSRTGFIRQMEAFEQNPVRNKSMIDDICKTIQMLEQQKKQTEAKMEAILEEHHKNMFGHVLSVPGIGKKTGLMLMVISQGFTRFNNAKQLCSYVGLSPRIFESGTSVKGKVKICKMGMSRVRAMLYVCSWSAIKCNAACKALYDRLLSKGKPKMVALIAVANKLLKQVFAIATKGIPYDENYLQKTCL